MHASWDATSPSPGGPKSFFCGFHNAMYGQVPNDAHQLNTNVFQLVGSGPHDCTASGLTHDAAGILHLANAVYLHWLCHAAKQELEQRFTQIPVKRCSLHGKPCNYNDAAICDMAWRSAGDKSGTGTPAFLNRCMIVSSVFTSGLASGSCRLRCSVSSSAAVKCPNGSGMNQTPG